MKKAIYVFIAICIMITFLSACTTVEHKFELSHDISGIEQIVIYNTETSYYESNIHNLINELEPNYIIEADQQSDFLEELLDLDLDFEEDVSIFPIPMDGGYDYTGYIVCIVYNNGYDIIAEQGQFRYSKSSDEKESYWYGHMDYCGTNSWEELINKYISQ